MNITHPFIIQMGWVLNNNYINKNIECNNNFIKIIMLRLNQYTQFIFIRNILYFHNYIFSICNYAPPLCHNIVYIIFFIFFYHFFLHSFRLYATFHVYNMKLCIFISSFFPSQRCSLLLYTTLNIVYESMKRGEERTLAPNAQLSSNAFVGVSMIFDAIS